MALKARGDFPVYLARHGETELNVLKRWQGGTNDSPLTARGRGHARTVGEILRAALPDDRARRFVASPQGRARTTMEIVLGVLGLPADAYDTDARLVEVDVGEWCGLSREQVISDPRWQARQADKWNVPCPGGESFKMVAERARAWFESLTGETVVVSHGGFGRILRALYLDIPWADISQLDEPHDCVFRIAGGQIARLEPPGAGARFDGAAPAP